MISKSDLQYYYNIVKKFNEENLIIPSKKTTIESVKNALDQCDDSDLKNLALLLNVEITDKTITKLKLDVLDKIQYNVYGHAIKGWNNLSKWGFLIALLYLFTVLSTYSAGEGRWAITTRIYQASNILIIMIILFGSSIVLKFLLAFKKSWNIRRLIQMELKKFSLKKNQKK